MKKSPILRFYMLFALIFIFLVAETQENEYNERIATNAADSESKGNVNRVRRIYK